MTVLEILGKRRKRGALRTELAKMLSMEASRFHYVLKVLLQLHEDSLVPFCMLVISLCP